MRRKYSYKTIYIYLTILKILYIYAVNICPNELSDYGTSASIYLHESLTCYELDHCITKFNLITKPTFRYPIASFKIHVRPEAKPTRIFIINFELRLKDSS